MRPRRAYGTPEGFLKGLDAKTGKELWSFQTGTVTPPIAWEQDGEQYIGVTAGRGGCSLVERRSRQACEFPRTGRFGVGIQTAQVLTAVRRSNGPTGCRRAVFAWPVEPTFARWGRAGAETGFPKNRHAKICNG